MMTVPGNAVTQESNETTLYMGAYIIALAVYLRGVQFSS